MKKREKELYDRLSQQDKMFEQLEQLEVKKGNRVNGRSSIANIAEVTSGISESYRHTSEWLEKAPTRPNTDRLNS